MSQGAHTALGDLKCSGIGKPSPLSHDSLPISIMPLYGFIIALLPESPYPFIRSRTPGPVLRALYPSFYLSSFLRAISPLLPSIVI